MAIIKCPECGREISDSANQCPNCGYDLRKQKIQTFISKAWVPTSQLFKDWWTYYCLLFKDRKYLKELIILVISITLGVLSICFACVSYDIDWILLVGGIMLCLIGFLILFARPIEFSRNKASAMVMKFSTLLLILGSLAVVLHGVVRLINPLAFNDRSWLEIENTQATYENGSQMSQGNSKTGTYTFTYYSEVHKVILNDDMTARLIYENGDTVYGNWNSFSFPDAKFIVKKPTLDNPYAKGTLHLYFRDGYVYFDYDQAMSKDPTNRESYTKDN